MKTFPCVLIAILLATTSTVHAATFTWNGGALLGSQWSRDNNWTTSAPPTNGTSALIFTGTDRLDANADSDWSILSLTFNSSAGAFVVQGNTLTIGVGGVSNNDNNNQLIENDIILSAAQTWAATSSSSLGIAGAVNTNTRLLTLTPTLANSTISINGAIGGGGGLTINGAGHVNFAGVANTYTGTTTVNSGTLFLEKAPGVNSIVGPLVIGDGTGAVQAEVIVNSQNQIANTGDVTVNDGGIFEISASDTIDNLTINKGLVSMGSAKSLGVSSATFTAGSIGGSSTGILILNGNVTTNAAADTATINPNVDLSGTTRTFTVADGAAAPDLTILGVISNGGLVKAGAGTLQMKGASNTYTGTTTVNAGTLELNKNNGQTAIAGPLVIGDGSGTGTVRLLVAEQIANSSSVTVNGGVLDLNGLNETIASLTMNGGAVNTGLGTLTLGGDVTSSVSGALVPAINGNLNLGGAARTLNVNNTAAAPIDLEINAIISSGSLIKDGVGTLLLSSPTGNTFAGGIAVVAGELVVGSNTAAGSGTLAMSTGASIRADGTARNLGNTFAISGDITIGGASDLKFSGNTQVQANLTLTVANTGLTTFSGAIGQDAGQTRSLTKAGVGTLVFSGGLANTYTGTTTVNAGELQLGKTGGVNAIAGPLVIGDGVLTDSVRLLASNQIADTSKVTVNFGSSLRLDSFVETIGGLALNGGSVLGTAGAATLTLGGDVTSGGTGASQIFPSVNLGGATRVFNVADAQQGTDLTTVSVISNGGINKVGSGTLSLSGPNTFAGGLSLNGGEVVLDGNTSAGTGTLTLNTGAVRAGTLPRTLANPVSLGGDTTIGGSLDITFSGPTSLDDDHTLSVTNTGLTTFSGVIAQGNAQPRSLTKTGAGTLVLSGANTFAGGLTLTAGEMAVGNNAAAGIGVLKLSSGAIRAEAAARTIANAVTLGGDITIGGSLDLTFSGPATLTSSHTLNISNTGLTTFAAIGQGANISALTKTGAGTLVLSGINTYSSTTNVNQGKVISSGSLAASKGVLVAGGATFEAINPQSLKALDVSSGGLAVLSSTTPTFLNVNVLMLTGSATLDINQRAMAINYLPNESPFATVRASIISGYAGGAWTGAGIRSSTAAANSNFAIGYAEASDILGPTGGVFLTQNVDGDTVLIRTTLSGDANLDGTVGFADLVAVAQHYGINTGNATWTIGDFNYDGNIGFADLVAVAQHYGGALPASTAIPGAPINFDRDVAAAFTQVPEPGAIAILFAACGLMLRRCRN